jgi:hypothetical protein
MLKKRIDAIAIKGFALLAVLDIAHHAMAQDATTPYPKMARSTNTSGRTSLRK